MSNINIVIVYDLELCMRCCRPAPNTGGGEAVHVDVHMEEVVRLHEQVRRVLNIEEHRGCSGAVLVPGDD